MGADNRDDTELQDLRQLNRLLKFDITKRAVIKTLEYAVANWCLDGGTLTEAAKDVQAAAMVSGSCGFCSEVFCDPDCPFNGLRETRD